MLRYFFIAFILGSISIAGLAGFRSSLFNTKSPYPPIEIFPDMKRQPRYDPQHESGFFADSRAGREPVAGTIPLGYTMPGSYLQAGAKNGERAWAIQCPVKEPLVPVKNAAHDGAALFMRFVEGCPRIEIAEERHT